ncbi:MULTISPECIES: hypothetical protein [unclassified Sphingobium]|uniref:hypothetical protein n=1 Tax=unclassified Sphingobium TaxID=2611147 RepID=UPI0022243B48|nr:MULTISPECIES: hypothetical protein [unclassified Sphingobium]MCW2382192.1 septal ring factor EnvC (AmiA/AmiB activator) [Sphingobium sp. B2D3B]MCW2397635.1 septal ring factor EnvC (AmiA/AmiB activator) [Sphingobium sp. B2D3C]
MATSFASGAEEREPLSPARKAALGGLGVIAVGWVALVVASGTDPDIGARSAWLINLIAVATAPLLILGGLAVILMRRPAAAVASLSADDAAQITSEARQALTMLTDVNGQLAGQTRETARAAEAASESLRRSMTEIAAQTDLLGQNSTTSLSRVSAVGDRLAAMVDTLPKLEDRLATLGETLARVGGDLGQRHDALDHQLQATALVAEEVRLQLTDAGKALSAQISGLRDGAHDAGEELTNLSELSSARLDLTIDRVKSVLDATEQRLDAQNAALAALVEQSAAAIDRASSGGLDRFASTCREMEALLDGLDARLEGQTGRSTQWLTQTSEQAVALAHSFDALEQASLARTQQLSGTLSRLSGETQALIETLGRGDGHAGQLIQRTEALLLALDSSVRELDESLPAAIGRVESQLGTMHERIRTAGPALEAVEAVATGVVSQLRESDKATNTQLSVLTEALCKSQDALTAQRQQIAALADAVEQAGRGMEVLGETVGPRLAEALGEVRNAADAAASRAREAMDNVIPAAAQGLAVASDKAIRQVVEATVSSELARLAQAADEAAQTAQKATHKLSGDMLTLAEAGKTLDLAISAHREKLETQDRDLISERSAMLIGALGEHAIDVGKWFDKDVSDSDWNAYLKGDQGLFARRATKLVNNAEAKQIHALYQDDATFREHVNRYIRDFEMLLRTVMAAKDGSTLALTMISSDIGKLYVALAQGIDRLRPN